ncbi:MAG: tRNA (guanine-N7)-methyltransferase [Myxococcota bacterium]
MVDDPYAAPPRLPEGAAVDLTSLLPGEGPLELEIGPGRGAFIIERATERRDVRIFGLEIRRKYACLVDAKLSDLGLASRARVFCEDARRALPRLGPDAQLDQVFVLFPDPWWKKKHRQRLVVVDPVISELGRLLRNDGTLWVVTDVPHRADEYEQRLSAAPFLRPDGDHGSTGPRTRANTLGAARTNREKHAERDGLPVHRLRYRRRPR